MKTKKKKVVTHLDRIRRNSTDYVLKKNEEYNNMSPIARRVHTLKELVMMMKAKQFIGGSSYGYVVDKDRNELETPGGDLQGLLIDNRSISCVGCAKAGIMFARAVLGNSVDKRWYGYELNNANEVSNEILGKNLATLVEALYELVHYQLPYDITRDELDSLSQYKKTLPDRWNAPNERLLMIYNNIIKNRGHFVIDGFTSARWT